MRVRVRPCALTWQSAFSRCLAMLWWSWLSSSSLALFRTSISSGLFSAGRSRDPKSAGRKVDSVSTIGRRKLILFLPSSSSSLLSSKEAMA